MKKTSKIYLSKQGKRDLKRKISKLKHDQKMLELELRSDQMKEDNMTRSELLARIDSLRADIAEKEFQFRTAKVLPVKRGASMKVALGSIVELLDRATGKIMRFQLVESVEADPIQGKISADSPLGQNLIGRKVDEIVRWTAGLKSMEMCLVAIN